MSSVGATTKALTVVCDQAVEKIAAQMNNNKGKSDFIIRWLFNSANVRNATHLDEFFRLSFINEQEFFVFQFL